jgi:hypothetical protein
VMAIGWLGGRSGGGPSRRPEADEVTRNPFDDRSG